MLKYLLFLVIIPSYNMAQVIPVTMKTDWTKAGNTSVILNSNMISLSTYGLVGDGVTDNSKALESVIASMNGKAATLVFTAGNFLFKSGISLPSNVTLKGAGSGNTKLKFNLNGLPQNCIKIGDYNTNTFTPIVSGFTKGSDSITLSSTVGFQAGQVIEIRQKNGSWDTNPAVWAAYSVGMVTKIKSILGNKITLEEKFRLTFDQALMPEVRTINAICNVGVECLGIERIDSSNAGYNISIVNAFNCSIKGVESSKSNGAHVYIDASAHVEVRDSYFHHAFAYTGAQTVGYGVSLVQHASECLIINNIFKHLRHAMILKQGANGNVVAYNYSTDPFRSEFPANAGADILMHGHYPFANLFEGNIVQNMGIDRTWGSAGPYNNFFRNRAELYGLAMTNGTVSSDNQIFIGNEITNTGFLMGNYVLAGTGHVEYANNVKGTMKPTTVTSINVNSYFLSAKPTFWSSTAWPSVGLPNNLGTGTIPAKENFIANNYTSCNTGITALAGEEKQSLAAVFPNPFLEILQIKLAKNEPAQVLIYDLSNRIIKDEKVTGNEIISISDWTHQTGVFILEIRRESSREYHKIIRIE